MRIRWKCIFGNITGMRQQRLRDLKRQRLLRDLEKAEKALLEQLKQAWEPKERREIQTDLLKVITQIIHL